MKQHLRDRHSGKWDKFSIYLVRKVDHIRELEALLLRVVDPRGNTKSGTLKGADDLKPLLKTKIRSVQAKELETLIGGRRKTKRTIKPRNIATTKSAKPIPVLAGIASKRFEIRHVYKGTLYKAHVLKSGMISFKGKHYSSPTAAALAIVDRPTVNGWSFWRYRNKKGEWVSLKNLR